MRKIIHVDMDAFFASVEQREDPRLRGRPVVVGGPPNSRGVVAAASYEARAFGIHSAMSSSQAGRLCPHAVFVSPSFAKYREVSQQIHQIFGRYTESIEPLSLDEAYLDVTTNLRDIAYATEVAREIRRDIREETGLTASAGVAPNKFLAKIASDINKPDGICVVTPERVEEFLKNLPVRKLPGVGPVTAERFERIGVRLIPDILRLPEATLTEHFGRSAEHYRNLARGEDTRSVQTEYKRKSTSVEDTFEQDVASLDEARRRLGGVVGELVRRLSKSGFRGRTVTLKVKYHDFRQVTRSRTLPTPAIDLPTISRVAGELLATTEVGEVPIRLLGVGVSQVTRQGPEQLLLPYAD